VRASSGVQSMSMVIFMGRYPLAATWKR
jgi:hypothetical protein